MGFDYLLYPSMYLWGGRQIAGTGRQVPGTGQQVVCAGMWQLYYKLWNCHDLDSLLGQNWHYRGSTEVMIMPLLYLIPLDIAFTKKEVSLSIAHHSHQFKESINFCNS